MLLAQFLRKYHDRMVDNTLAVKRSLQSNVKFVVNQVRFRFTALSRLQVKGRRHCYLMWLDKLKPSWLRVERHRPLTLLGELVEQLSSVKHM